VPHYLKTSDFLFGDYVPEPSKIKSANARKPNVELRRAIREIESGRHNKSTKSAAVEDNVPAFYKLQRDLYERGYD